MAAQTPGLTRGRLVFAGVAVAVLVSDRLTKDAIVAAIPEGSERAALDHVLFLQHLQNSCAAFSMCGPLSSNLLLVIAFLVAAGVAYYALRPPPQSLPASAFLGLILGGTLGNGLDRLLHGSVTDFLAVHWWPTFNVADSAISVGIVLLALGYGLRPQPGG